MALWRLSTVPDRREDKELTFNPSQCAALFPADLDYIGEPDIPGREAVSIRNLAR